MPCCHGSEADRWPVPPWLRSGGRLRVESLVDAVLSDTHSSSKAKTHEGIPTFPDDFRGRIRYRPARTTAQAPSDFDAERAVSWSKVSCRGPSPFTPPHSLSVPNSMSVCRCSCSQEEPEWELRLEHCHGYAGHNNSAPNLFLTAAGHLVYYAAALGVVSVVEREIDQVCRSLRLFCTQMTGILLPRLTDTTTNALC